MMKNKIKYLSALMLSLTMFTGCQLALEGKADDSVRGDRFVGVSLPEDPVSGLRFIRTLRLKR